MARGCIVPTCAAGNTKCGWIGCTWMVPFWPSWRWSRARSTGGPGGQSAALTRACPPGRPQRAVLAWLRRCERPAQRYLLGPRPGLGPARPGRHAPGAAGQPPGATGDRSARPSACSRLTIHRGRAGLLAHRGRRPVDVCRALRAARPRRVSLGQGAALLALQRTAGREYA